LFVEPGRIGAGVGRTLWEDCLATAARIGLSRIRVESDPFAEGFYLMMGATRVGDVRSQSIPERRLPLLGFDMGEVPIELRPVDTYPTWPRGARRPQWKIPGRRRGSIAWPTTPTTR
jgi:hypothetical protein